MERLARRVTGWLILGFALVIAAPLSAQEGQGSGSCAVMPLILPDHLFDIPPSLDMDTPLQLNFGSRPGQIGWLSWDGERSVAALATALHPPGTAAHYRDPFDPTVQQLRTGTWIGSVTGVRNAQAVRQALDALIGQPIRVPTYDQTQGQGAGLAYRMQRFVQIRLEDYRLTGNGWLRFTYQGEFPCQPNRPPQIHSQAPSVATTGEWYAYTIEASDPDPNDLLQYYLAQAPQGMQIDGDTGEVSWRVDDNWQGNHSEPNTYCLAPGGAAGGGEFADVVVVVDESGSMSGEHAWIGEMVLPLESHLNSHGIGSDEQANRYGLLGFEAAPRPLNVGAGLMGSWDALREATFDLKLYGGTEDGWRAIDYALNHYPLREGAAKNLILITDEGRDIVNANLSYNGLLTRLQENSVILNVVVNARFECFDQTGQVVSALGMDADGVGYRADGQGGYLTCEQASATWGHRNTVNTLEAYVPLALDSGGAAWDLDYLRAGGTTAQSFTAALMAIKTREILENLPPRPLADLTIAGIVEVEDAIEVVVGNRGLKDVEESVRIELLDPHDGVAASQELNGLAIGEFQTMRFALPDWEAPHLRVQIAMQNGGSECTTSNNQLTVPWVTLRVVDQGGLYDEQRFTLEVETDNRPPEIVSLAPTEASVGGYYRYQIDASDPDHGDTLRFDLEQGPTGMYLDPVQGLLVFKPGASQIGNHEVTIRVTDLLGEQAEQQYVLHVNQDYVVPRIVSQAPTRAVQGYDYRYGIDVNADAGAELHYDLLHAPGGARIEQGELHWAELHWAVPQGSAGQQVEMVLRVMDQHGNYDLQFIQLTIAANNAPPQFHSQPPEWVELGQTWRYVIDVSDPDGDAVQLSLNQGPQGMVQEADGTTLSWTPGESHPDPVAVLLHAQDSLGDSAEQGFTITVYDGPNQAPVFDSSPDLHALVGHMWQYLVVVSDPNGDPLQVRLLTAPANADWDPDTQSLTWLPQADQIGDNLFTWEVTDPRGGVATQSFTVQVAEPNRIPEFVSTPPTDVESGQVYRYTAQAVDPDGDSLSYHLSEAPAGALINAITGQLQWLAGQPGDYAFELHVDDGRGGVAVQAFVVQVSEPVPPPSLCNADVQ